MANESLWLAMQCLCWNLLALLRSEGGRLLRKVVDVFSFLELQWHVSTSFFDVVEIDCGVDSGRLLLTRRNDLSERTRDSRVTPGLPIHIGSRQQTAKTPSHLIAILVPRQRTHGDEHLVVCRPCSLEKLPVRRSSRRVEST